jgi:hypothetical protein
MGGQFLTGQASGSENEFASLPNEFATVGKLISGHNIN